MIGSRLEREEHLGTGSVDVVRQGPCGPALTPSSAGAMPEQKANGSGLF